MWLGLRVLSLLLENLDLIVVAALMVLKRSNKHKLSVLKVGRMGC
jgi:hypothetical protein